MYDSFTDIIAKQFNNIKTEFEMRSYNLFNEAYAEHGGYSGNIYSYPAQSRRFIVGAEYKF